MSVTAVVKDPELLTMTVTAEYDVTAERAWELWGDPRQLERWWGRRRSPRRSWTTTSSPAAVRRTS